MLLNYPAIEFFVLNCISQSLLLRPKQEKEWLPIRIRIRNRINVRFLFWSRIMIEDSDLNIQSSWISFLKWQVWKSLLIHTTLQQHNSTSNSSFMKISKPKGPGLPYVSKWRFAIQKSKQTQICWWHHKYKFSLELAAVHSSDEITIMNFVTQVNPIPH